MTQRGIEERGISRCIEKKGQISIQLLTSDCDVPISKRERELCWEVHKAFLRFKLLTIEESGFGIEQKCVEVLCQQAV